MGVSVIVTALLISGIAVLAFSATVFFPSNSIRLLRSSISVGHVRHRGNGSACVNCCVFCRHVHRRGNNGSACVIFVVSFVVTSIIVAMAALVSIAVSFVVVVTVVLLLV